MKATAVIEKPGAEFVASEVASEAVVRRVAVSHNLTESQFAHVVSVLGRLPTISEISIFGVMYSEHCSYCSSKPYLKTFPTEGPNVLVKAGEENAGVIDLGNGWTAVFKCESHNHPSAVEPYQGAATGVGGIVRDIFTMGARPVALLDSLRFGSLGSARTRYLFDGVVRGIAGYGNCLGVPTVGGEIAFDKTYQGNPLVNVMCIGLMRREELATGAAEGVGNPVLYAGSATGRDGLGGASFASRELNEGSDEDRPAVQIGDPFIEKCLIEATLEALKTGLVVGIQDMGAAGLTCSTCETAARGAGGIEIDVDLVPKREAKIAPFEIMISESQERMLLIVKQGAQKDVRAIFEKWGLHAVEIGRVTDTGRMVVKQGDKLVADIPVGSLTDDAPIYNRPTRRPAYLKEAQQLDPDALAEPKDLNKVLRRLLKTPTIADKAAVYEQYDHMVQVNTAVWPGRGDAAVLRLKHTPDYLAATLDGNGHYCYLDPYEGGKLAIVEAARNLAAVGAEPLAVTDCLNFGSPLDPEIMWQFKECVRGMAEACAELATPVTGGNVSLYNESPEGAIDPTPVIGMVGLIRDAQPVGTSFKNEGDMILLAGRHNPSLGASHYLLQEHKLKKGRPPKVRFEALKDLIRFMTGAVGAGLVQSAHDLAEGGLAVALAECCFDGPEPRWGAELDNIPSKGRADTALFGETAATIILSCAPESLKALKALALERNVPLKAIGRVGGARLVIGPWIDSPIRSLHKAWRSGVHF